MDSKTTIGRTIRSLRESAGFSQERLAEKAGITYQYLSAVENGKENFTIGILEALSSALGLGLPALVERAFESKLDMPMVDLKFFNPEVPLPPQLTTSHLRAAFNETHKVIRLINTTLIKVVQRPLSAHIHKNNFSGIVSNILCDSFSRLTPYKHNHHQRYPDLVCKSATGEIISGLEVKSTIRTGKGGESHNGHSGWHVIACFELNEKSGDICFIHAMFADSMGHDRPDSDWKYVGSKVNEETGSQRTETYTTTPTGTTKLRHGSVYLDTAKVDISRWRIEPSVSRPDHSPFNKKKK